MNDGVLQRLREAVGAGNVDAASSTITPLDRDSAIAAVRVCAETATSLAVRSAVSSEVAAPDGGVLLSLDRLATVEVHAPGLTLRAGTGASAAAGRDAAAAAGLAVVGWGSGALPSSVGSVVARGAVPRRSLTGIEAVLATGETVAFGGGVLKDVVGYDVPALLLGSMGRLGVLLGASFRLEPAGARSATGPAPGVVAADPRLARAFDPQGLLRSPA